MENNDSKLSHLNTEKTALTLKSYLRKLTRIVIPAKFCLFVVALKIMCVFKAKLKQKNQNAFQGNILSHFLSYFLSFFFLFDKLWFKDKYDEIGKPE